MAQQKDETEEQAPGIPLPYEEEEDVVFRAQMKAMDMVLGYWKHFVAVIGAFMLVVLAISAVISYKDSVALDAAEAMAEIDRRMPVPDQMAQLGIVPLDDPNDPKRTQLLQEAAKRYQKIGEDSSGIGAAEALLKAGDTWKRAGDMAKAEAAWQACIDAMDKGLPAFAARNAMASARLAGGDTAGAIALYRENADVNDGVLAETGLLNIADAHAAAGDSAAARAALEEFKQRFPASPELPRVEAQLQAGSATAAAGL